jgi:hypothetical protein
LKISTLLWKRGERGDLWRRDLFKKSPSIPSTSCRPLPKEGIYDFLLVFAKKDVSFFVALSL